MLSERRRGVTCTCKHVYTGKCTYPIVCVILLLSMTMYVYMYSSVHMQAFAITKSVNSTMHDLQRWRSNIDQWVHMLTDDTRVDEHLYTQRRNTAVSTQRYSQVIRSHQYTSVEENRTSTTVKASVNSTQRISSVLLTLFTSWKTNPEKYTCHNNTVINWNTLKPSITTILFTNEEPLAKEVKRKGWNSLPVRQVGSGIPVLKFMYRDAREVSKSQFYAFANGDILFTSTLIQTVMAVVNSTVIPKDRPILIVGRRTNVQNIRQDQASSWRNVAKTARQRGKLFNVWAEDYFITSADYPWTDIPEVVIGRRAYDNWLVSNARKHNHTTIDATLTLLALHQTTQAGNMEGHGASNSEYNHRLLSRLYKRLHYDAGSTSCAAYFTRYDDDMNPKIERRLKTC